MGGRWELREPTHLLSNLIDEHQGAVRVVKYCRQLPQRLAHEPCL